MSNETSDAARTSLERVAQVRATLADRVRLPAWYQALYSAAATAVFVVPALVVRPHHHISSSLVVIVTAVASIVISLQNVVVGDRAKVRMSCRPMRTYPGTRGPILAAMGVLTVGSAVTWLAAVHISWPVALACGLVSAALLTAAREWTIAAVRRDIRTGRAVAR